MKNNFSFIDFKLLLLNETYNNMKINSYSIEFIRILDTYNEMDHLDALMNNNISMFRIFIYSGCIIWMRSSGFGNEQL